MGKGKKKKGGKKSEIALQPASQQNGMGKINFLLAPVSNGRDLLTIYHLISVLEQ